MSECQDFKIRDQLPDYVHGTLDDVSRARVESHIELCAECADEVTLLQAIVSAMPVRSIDVAAIAGSIPTYGVRDIRSARSVAKPPRTWYRSGSLQVAAAFLIAAVGVTGAVVYGRPGTNATMPTAAHANAGVSLVNVSDLSDENLETLISSMDKLEASPPVEPDSVLARPPHEGGNA